MGVLRLLLQRARAGLGLLATLLLLTAGTTAIVAGTVGYARAGATEATREALVGVGDPTEAAVRAETRQGPDPAGQDALARSAIAAAFSPAPVETVSAHVSEPRPVAGRQERLVALSSASLMPGDPRFADRVTVVAGTWPRVDDAGGPGLDGGTAGDRAVEGALLSPLAERWGVAVGDTLTVGDLAVTVTATWQPADPADPFWFGEPESAESGSSPSGSAGGADLVVLPPGAVPSVGGDPFLRWTVLPETGQVLPEHLPALADGAAALRNALDDPDLVVRGLVVDGDLAPTAARAAQDLAAARALSVIPISVLLLVSVIAVVQITRVQAATRTTEAELLVARGASRRQVLSWSVLEAGAAGTAGTALGVALALAALRAVPSGPEQTVGTILVGAAAGLAVLTSLLVVNVLQVRALQTHRPADRSGRDRDVVPAWVLVLVLGGGLLALWQLRFYESPIVTTPDGQARVDLLASAAPALLLASAAALTASGLGPLAGVGERLTAARTGWVAHLAATQVSRRLVVYAAPLALVVLACGAVTVASLYARTAGDLRDDLAVLGNGSDVHTPYLGPARDAAGLPVLPELTGASDTAAATAVWQTSARAGTAEVALTVAPAPDLGAAIRLPQDLVDPERAAALLHTADPADTGIPVPAAAEVLTVGVEVTVGVHPEHRQRLEAELAAVPGQVRDREPDLAGQPLRVQVAREREELLAGFTAGHTMSLELYAVDRASGRLAHLATEPVPLQPDLEVAGDGATVSPTTVVTRHDLELRVPAGRLASLGSLHLQVPRGGGYQADVVVHGITDQDGTDLLQTDDRLLWSVNEPGILAVHDPVGGELRVLGIAGRYPDLDGAGRREVMIGPHLSGEQPRVPLLVTRQLATTLDLDVGSPLSLSAWGTALEGEVAQVVHAVPGTLAPSAVLADRDTVQAALLPQHRELPAPTGFWSSSEDPAATGEALRALPGLGTPTTVVDTAVTDAAAAARGMLWVAAAGAMLLALTGTAAVAVALLRLRRADVVVLRALGAAPGGLAWSRAVEFVAVVVTAAVVGVAAGWVIGVALVPELARSTTPQDAVRIPVRLRLEWPLWLISMGTFAAATAGLLAHQGRRVRTHARDNEYREEVR